MKEIAKLLCFIFFLSQQSSFSQWFLQNSGVMINLNSVYFLNVNVGLAAGDEGVILKTTNGGNDWFQLTSGTTNNLNTLYFVNSDTGWAAGDNAVIIKTTNGGLTWENQTSNPPYGNISSIYFTSPGSGWATGYIEYSPGNFDSYISKTLNGGITWEDNYNIMDEKMFDIMFPDNLNGWDVGTAIYVTTDGGSNWYGSGTGIEFHSVYFVDQFTGWIAGTDYINNKGIVIHTTDGGITWYPPVNFPSISLNSLFFTNLSNGWVSGSGGSIFYTPNGGNSWQIQASGVTSNLNSVFFVNDLVGWTVGNNGVILKTINSGTPVELTSFTCTVTGNKVHLRWETKSELNNKGFEIERQENVSQSPYVNNWKTIGFLSGNGTTTQNHLFTFEDKNINSGKYLYRLKQINFDGSYEYSREVEADISYPVGYFLEQNFPNPFNPVTTINYQIKTESFVSLKVFNMIGEEIASLVDEKQSTGNYSVKFDGSKYSGGIYFYRLTTGNFSSVRKMVLLK